MRARLAALRAASRTTWSQTPRLRAHLTVLAGIAATAVGAGLIYVPAGAIAGGVQLAVFGLFCVTVPNADAGRR